MFGWFQNNKVAIFRVIGYLTAMVILLTVFLYLTFPWQKLSRFVEIHAEKIIGSSIDVEKSEVRFPFKLVWSDVVFNPKISQKVSSIQVDQITLEWEFRHLLRRRLELLWSVKVAGGDGRGQIAAQPTDQGMQYRLEGYLRDIPLARIIQAIAPNAYEIEGTLGLTEVRHDWVGARFLRGSGRAKLEITDSRFEIENPIEPLTLPFNRISAHLALKAGVAQLEQVLAQGPVMDITGSGNIVFRPRILDSVLNLSSRATIRNPTGALALLAGSSSNGGGSAQLALRGTFRRPTFYLNGTPIFTLTTS